MCIIPLLLRIIITSIHLFSAEIKYCIVLKMAALEYNQSSGRPIEESNHTFIKFAMRDAIY
jgi:hypothetical protein